MPQLDWSDLRHALAIGEGGSVAAAARRLGVNATTVQRRLDALEQGLGARLFERSRVGWHPTESGRTVLELARRMADQAEEVERRVLGRDRELTGVLRVTTAFVAMEHLLPQPLADFARAFPGIEVEVVENAYLVDLARRPADAPGNAGRQADVALRLSAHVADHLVGRQLGMSHCKVYARRGAPGLPQAVTPVAELLRDAPWVAFERDGPTGRVYDRWLAEHLPPQQVRVRVDIFNAAAAVLHTGLGVGVLPTFMEPKHPELVAVSEVIPALDVPVWMLTHPDLRSTARVKAFIRFVGDQVAERLRQHAA